MCAENREIDYKYNAILFWMVKSDVSLWKIVVEPKVSEKNVNIHK